MYFQPRTDRNGKTYFSVLYRDKDGKLRRLPKEKTEHLRTAAEAELFVKSELATYEARKAAHLAKLSWQSQFYNFTELLDLYGDWQCKRAPNSWKSCIQYLKHWVFPFYLVENQHPNVNNWHLHFQSFLDWLQSPTAMVRRERKKPLAASTVNNIVKALNTFLECLLAYNRIDKDAVRKCPCLPEHALNHRTWKDVIPPDERDLILAQLRAADSTVADFFLVMWHTGMRFAELFGLPYTALMRGPVPEGMLREELNRAGIQVLGYLYLDSQPLHDDRRREADKSIKRKPLKSCRVISPKYARIIPIRTKEVWNILATRHKAQATSFQAKKYTADQSDYVLFDDAEWNKTVNGLRAAYQRLGREPKGYHCCRHSFTTFLVGETHSYMAVRLITGHRSQQAFERYLHTFEEIARRAQQGEQDIDIIA